jgi:hypothetical protein
MGVWPRGEYGSLVPLPSLFVYQLLWGKQLLLPHAPTMMCSLVTGPSNRVKQSWCKTSKTKPKNFHLFELIYLKHLLQYWQVSHIFNNKATQFSKRYYLLIGKSKINVTFWSLCCYPTPWPVLFFVLLNCNNIHSSPLDRNLGIMVNSTFHLYLSQLKATSLFPLFLKLGPKSQITPIIKQMYLRRLRSLN